MKKAKFTYKDLAESKCAHLNTHIIESTTETPKKKDKYNSSKVEVNGLDGKTYKLSKKEAKRFYELKVLLELGEIQDLRQQVRYDLLSNEKVKRKNGAMKYMADFVYFRNGKEIVEDAKGFRTATYKRKRLLMKEIYGIEILET